MSQVIPVIYHEGLLVPQVQLRDIAEGQRFQILIAQPDEWALGQEDIEPWTGFISVEDALRTVRQTAGQFGPISARLLEEIAMDETLLEGSLL